MQSGKLAVASVINLLHLCLSQLRACKSERTGRFQTSPIAESMIQTDTHVRTTYLYLTCARAPAGHVSFVGVVYGYYFRLTSGHTPYHQSTCMVGPGAKVNLLPFLYFLALILYCTEIQQSYCACSVRNCNNYLT